MHQLGPADQPAHPACAHRQAQAACAHACAHACAPPAPAAPAAPAASTAACPPALRAPLGAYGLRVRPRPLTPERPLAPACLSPQRPRPSACLRAQRPVQRPAWLCRGHGDCIAIQSMSCLCHNTVNCIATQSFLLPAFLLQYNAVYCDTIHPPSLQYKLVYCNTIIAHSRFLTAIQISILQYNPHSLKIQLGSGPFQIYTINIYIYIFFRFSLYIYIYISSSKKKSPKFIFFFFIFLYTQINF